MTPNPWRCHELIREENAGSESAAAHGLIVDCSHGNSGKDEHRQAEVVRNIASRIAEGEEGISGIMMESFIEGGSQKPAPLAELTYGQSITDKCLSWQITERCCANLRKLWASAAEDEPEAKISETERKA